MNARPDWFYDEMRHVGVDYSDAKEAGQYDERHSRFRNVEEENRAILDAIQLEPGQTLIDLGTGTGAFALQAAPRCEKVFAVDISPAMLARASQKAKESSLGNIEFLQGGFLTYEHAAEPVDAAVSKLALHHLPDFWKLIALQRIRAMLRPGGRLYLMDVVYGFDSNKCIERIDEMLKQFAADAGAEAAASLRGHVQNEYSTLDWIMEGLLARAGFRIDRADYRRGYLAHYLCTREGEEKDSSVRI
jgi:ubiquinone/menaquinone biosynthesis C-methylase UbiE